MRCLAVPFMSSRTIFMKDRGANEVGEESAYDIDTEEDWKSAEIKYMHRGERMSHLGLPLGVWRLEGS